MSSTHRQRIVRADGRAVNIVQRRAHLSYCFTGCCCGRTDRGYAKVPVDVYKEEWLRRKMRNTVHLTKAGCLGPCVLANVASLVFDGRAVWFHSVNSPWQVRRIYEYIDSMPNHVKVVFDGKSFWLLWHWQSLLLNPSSLNTGHCSHHGAGPFAKVADARASIPEDWVEIEYSEHRRA